MADIYTGTSTITGELSTNSKVSYRNILTGTDKLTVSLILAVAAISSLALVTVLYRSLASGNGSLLMFAALAAVLLVEIIRLLQTLTLAIFAYFARDPIPMTAPEGLHVAVLTTIVPGKEPFELVARTLLQMKQIDAGANNTIDVWLLDEGNDPWVKAQCEAIGVKHFSRKGIEAWNQPAGPFKAKTKHGNHNAWRAQNENNYDIVAQMDPDHVPRQNFLARTLGYFSDPDIAFVVAPQVYGNLKDNWIARASAFQAYIFHGIIQRGGNGLGAPLLIGTNHLYRVTAFKQIGGYQDSIIEDHLTSMVIYGSTAPNGKKWKGVYTPDILAVGEGPTSFTDYFNQQKRWAYGIWDIARTSTYKQAKGMKKPQALSFLMLQFFYPSVAIAWFLSSIATVLFGISAASDASYSAWLLPLWLTSIVSCLGLFFWLRKFNLVEHERRDWGIGGMALMLMCIPVYVSAGWQAIRKKPLTYAVTAKGNLTSPDTLQTFMPHLHWLAFNVAAVAVLVLTAGLALSGSIAWTIEHIAICLLPIALHYGGRLRSNVQRQPLPSSTQPIIITPFNGGK